MNEQTLAWDIKDPYYYDSSDRSHFDIEIKADDEEGTFVGHASVFNKTDLQNEVVSPGAFKRTLKMKNGRFPLLWQHDKTEPIGFVEASEDAQGLRVKGKLAVGVQRAKDALELIKAQIVSGMSIGFRVIKDQVQKDDGTRVLKEIDLWEVSLVTFPANPHALITGVKSVVPYQNLPLGDEDMAWDSSVAKKLVREWAGAEDGPNSKYKRAFLWYDRQNAEDFGAYKLPVATVIDGSLTAVPSGIFAAGAAVQGARGGVNIPGSDKKTIRSHLDRYYRKMDRTPPWSAQMSIEEQMSCFADLVPFMDEKHLDDLRSLLPDNRTQVTEPFDWLKSENPEPDRIDANVREAFSFLDDYVK